MGSSHSKQKKRSFEPPRGRPNILYPKNPPQQPLPPYSKPRYANKPAQIPPSKPLRAPKPSCPAPKKKPKSKPAPFVRAPDPRYNVFLAADSFGFHQHFDVRLLISQGCRYCYTCKKHFYADEGIVVHNIEGCRAAFHGNCVRRWLPQFIDRRGRHCRPWCPACNRTMNIKQVSGRRSKQNLLGDFAAFS